MLFVKKLNVLMVTGVYIPEVNGAVQQCSQVINKLKESINYSVLTGASYGKFNNFEYINEVPVARFYMPKNQKIKYIIGAFKFFHGLTKILKKIDIIHIHGFSKRNAIVILISLILRKKVVVKMTSYGYDDPISIKNKSYILWSIFKRCHAFIGISPAFQLSYQESRLPEHKYNFIPNGVDLEKFSPISTEEKKALKANYGFEEYDKLIVFIGHFSREKRPELLYKAWLKLHEQGIYAKLIFIGHTKDHFEVDDGIVESIRQDGFQRGVLSQIKFVEQTPHVDEYLKMADVFVLPSIREGLPNVLLEAMSSALPCIVKNLPGITDWLIVEGVTGVLFSSDAPEDLANKIAPYLALDGQKQKTGRVARHYMESNFSSASTSHRVLNLYMKIMEKNCSF